MRVNHLPALLALLSTVLTSGLMAQLIPNDHFSQAAKLSGERPIIEKGSLISQQGSIKADHEPGEPRHAGAVVKGSVWYQITAVTTRRFVVTVSSETADIVLALYTGASVKDVILVHRFDDCASPCISRKKTEPLSTGARVEFKAVAGQAYYIAVDYEGGKPGEFEIRVDDSTNPLQPELEVLPADAAWESLLLLDQAGQPIDPASKNRDFFRTWMVSTIYNGPAFKKAGPAPIGYGIIDSLQITTPLGESRDFSPPKGARHSAYLRTTFTPELDLRELGVEGIFDDGAIIYLDGQEVARINVSADDDAENWKTTSSSSRVGPHNIYTEDALQYAVIRNLRLKAGVPVHLGVSLHNTGPNSTDLGMAMRLFGVTAGE